MTEGIFMFDPKLIWCSPSSSWNLLVCTRWAVLPAKLTWSSHSCPCPSWDHRKPSWFPECTSLGSRDIQTIQLSVCIEIETDRAHHTRVPSSHVIPFCLFASVYEKPSTCPVFRPNKPCRLGPILLPSDSTTEWHCWHLVLKRLAPFLASPARNVSDCSSEFATMPYMQMWIWSPDLQHDLNRACWFLSCRLLRYLARFESTLYHWWLSNSSGCCSINARSFSYCHSAQAGLQTAQSFETRATDDRYLAVMLWRGHDVAHRMIMKSLDIAIMRKGFDLPSLKLSSLPILKM